LVRILKHRGVIKCATGLLEKICDDERRIQAYFTVRDEQFNVGTRDLERLENAQVIYAEKEKTFLLLSALLGERLDRNPDIGQFTIKINMGPVLYNIFLSKIIL